MEAAIVVVVIVIIFGALFGLRSSKNAGMPSKEVLKRATERARRLEEQEKEDD